MKPVVKQLQIRNINLKISYEKVNDERMNNTKRMEMNLKVMGNFALD